MSLENEFERRVVNSLERIAKALEGQRLELSVIAAALAPKAPNWQYPLSDYSSFDFSSKGIEVLATDDDGPTALGWGGYTWNRHTGSNRKFKNAIWFSRPEGKDGESGKTRYVMLIKFAEVSEVYELPKHIRSEVGQPPAKPQATPASPAYDPTKDPRLVRAKLQAPSAALAISDAPFIPANLELFKHLVLVFKIDKDTANDIWKQNRSEPAQAIKALDQHVF